VSAGRRVLLLGGTSEIGIAIARELCARTPRELLLAGRDLEALELACADLRRQPGVIAVDSALIDALDTTSHAGFIASAAERLGGIDVAILAVGVLGERGGQPQDVAAALSVLEVNAVGAASLLMRVCAYMKEQSAGQVIVLSSVAVERPRRALATYGASKAALDALAQAIGDDLRSRGVRMLVVRPGFVRTKMTAHLAPPPGATDASTVARITVDAVEREAHTVWAPRWLRPAAAVAAHLPRTLFRRLSL